MSNRMPDEYVHDLMACIKTLAGHGGDVLVKDEAARMYFGVGRLLIPKVRLWPNCCGPVIGRLIVDAAGTVMLVPIDQVYGITWRDAPEAGTGDEAGR